MTALDQPIIDQKSLADKGPSTHDPDLSAPVGKRSGKVVKNRGRVRRFVHGWRRLRISDRGHGGEARIEFHFITGRL